ncbi:GNAT family N-acetyltransferase [Glycomyces sp. MUSA5-2]|uniref:GNAT family N-acetyltransferase n=1 Tax=Glycomyces sp. MUSA5-2 TaxID=2053002 RepID=UPI003008F6D2
MRLTDLTLDLAGPVRDLMAAGAPFVRARDDSDYWLYATHFADTCPVVLDDEGVVVAAAIAVQSQTRPGEIYLQDLMVDAGHRRQGMARMLVGQLRAVAAERGCTRITLTSAPENHVAHRAWMRLGFTNRPGDQVTAEGVEVITDFKGVGKHRAVYDLDLAGRRRA